MSSFSYVLLPKTPKPLEFDPTINSFVIIMNPISVLSASLIVFL